MSWPNWLPIRPQLRDLSPYGAPQIDALVRLNTNENPYSLSEELQSVLETKLRGALADLNRYPDRDALELRRELAVLASTAKSEFDENWIWAANGSNEIIQSIALAFEGDALGFEPSYSMHPLITKSVGKNWISLQRDANYAIDLDEAEVSIAATGAKLIFLTTPNNPTGTVTPLADIERLALIATTQGALLIVDEAYGEFSDQDSATGLIKRHPNILVSKTMSKAFAFAGARLGYLIADPKVIEAMLLVRLPYHLSSLTQAAALAALSLRAELSRDVTGLKDAREDLATQLENLGLKVWSSEANFLLFTGFDLPERELWQRLVDSGVLIRDVGIPGHLRVTVGTRSENRTFIAALTKVIRG